MDISKTALLGIAMTNLIFSQMIGLEAHAEIITPEGFSTLIPDNVKFSSNNAYGAGTHIVGSGIHVSIDNFGDIADLNGNIIGKTIISSTRISGDAVQDLNKLAKLKSIVTINTAGDISDASGTIIGRTMDTLAGARPTQHRKKVIKVTNAFISQEGKIINESTGKSLGQTLPGLISKTPSNPYRSTDPHKLMDKILSVSISNAGYISELSTGQTIGTTLGAEE